MLRPQFLLFQFIFLPDFFYSVSRLAHSIYCRALVLTTVNMQIDLYQTMFLVRFFLVFYLFYYERALPGGQHVLWVICYFVHGVFVKTPMIKNVIYFQHDISVISNTQQDFNLNICYIVHSCLYQ